MSFYKMLWSKIGGRPWTFIMRDIYHEAEWVTHFIWFSLGILVLSIFHDVCLAFILFGVYTFGYISGHLFWGKKWIKGQKGD